MAEGLEADRGQHGMAKQTQFHVQTFRMRPNEEFIERSNRSYLPDWQPIDPVARGETLQTKPIRG